MNAAVLFLTMLAVVGTPGAVGACQVIMPDDPGGQPNTIIFDGCNLHIRDGSGDTACPPHTGCNGLGNLIVGYNEGADLPRAGSHNLVVGPYHSFTSFGGFVAGRKNTISAPGASVSGGEFNTASGMCSAVSGGFGSRATGDASWVGGGFDNLAANGAAAVMGGAHTTASGVLSVVGGGVGHDARDVGDGE